MNILICLKRWTERRGLSSILTKQNRNQRIYEAENHPEAIAMMKLIDFGMIILETSSEVWRNLELIASVKDLQSNCKVLVYSDEEHFAVFYLRNGADGFCAKKAGQEDFLHAVETLSSGESSRYLHIDLLLGLLEGRKTLNGKKS